MYPKELILCLGFWWGSLCKICMRAIPAESLMNHLTPNKHTGQLSKWSKNILLCPIKGKCSLFGLWALRMLGQSFSCCKSAQKWVEPADDLVPNIPDTLSWRAWHLRQKVQSCKIITQLTACCCTAMSVLCWCYSIARICDETLCATTFQCNARAPLQISLVALGDCLCTIVMVSSQPSLGAEKKEGDAICSN